MDLNDNICEECGALVPDQTIEKHKQWHESSLSWLETLTDKIDRLLQSLPTKNPGPCGSVVFTSRHGTKPCRCQFWESHTGVHRCSYCNQEWANQ
jgi:hypothetical protein